MSKATTHWNRTKYIQRLQTVQQPVSFPVLETEPTLTYAIALKFPFLGKIFRKLGIIDDKPQNNNQGLAFDHRDSAMYVSQGLLLNALLVSALDFVRIPLLYLASYLLGIKIPFTLANNLQWLYSTVILSLTLMSFIVPVLAPVAAFMLAGVVFFASTFFLGQLIIDRIELKQEKHTLSRAFEVAERGMEVLQKQALLLEQRLKATSNTTEMTKIWDDVDKLEVYYQKQKILLTDLKQKQQIADAKTLQVGWVNLLDRTFSLALATVSMIGLVLIMTLPPVGAAMLLITGTMATAYLVARLITPAIISATTWAMNKIKAFTAEKPGLEVAPMIRLKNSMTALLEQKAAHQANKPIEIKTSSVVAEPGSHSVSKQAHGFFASERLTSVQDSYASKVEQALALTS